MKCRAGAQIVTLATVAVGCLGASGSDRLEGRWVGVRAEGTGGDALAAANAFSTGTELTFHHGTLTVVDPRSTQTGRYRVLKQDAATVVITTDRDPDQPQTFIFANERTMRWALLDGKSIVFARR